MALNGISTLQLKRDRQLAKLQLAAAKRLASGNSRPYLDITQLPTQYPEISNSNILVNNTNVDGLVTGRPWVAESPISTDFIFTAATTAADETFVIPCQDLGTFDATVDWGDGSTSAITAYNDADLAHTYVTAGDHQIRISGTFPNIYFNDVGDKLKVKSVDNLGVVGWVSFFRAFFGCSSMTSFVAGHTETSGVTNMGAMFYLCSSLTTLDVSSFNTSNVTNMFTFFRDCSSLTTLDVSSFDTSSVVNMAEVFRDCTSLTDIVGVEDFNIEGLTATNDLRRFATGVTLPTARYDALLINWDAQDPFDGMSPDFGSSKYTAGGTAAAARANLINTDGWVITDGGTA
jgi:surface protein